VIRPPASGAPLRLARGLAVTTVVAAVVWVATEWTAWRLGFQPRLGRPWAAVLGWRIYAPWSLFTWWVLYGAYAPRIFNVGGMIAASSALAALATALAMDLRGRRKDPSTYGSARWATLREVRAAGLLGLDGLVLGRIGRRRLRHDGLQHVLCFAPTRSGKGVGIVVPSLLTWPDSVVTYDIKGENWRLTAGWRMRFGRVLRFDPTDPESDAYNPLMEVRRGETEVRDVQNIADILVDPEGALERRNHWEKTSHALLVGAILHVLYAEPDKTLAGVATLLSDPRRSIEATLSAMMTTPHLGDRPHPVVAQAARELLNKSHDERSGVVSTAMSFLGLYRDPVAAKVTSRCDWRIADLVEPDRPTSLYLVVPPSDISRTKPLIRMILNQIGRRLTEDMHAREKGRRLLLLLDEFPALGRLDFFESTLAFMAGYRIKALLIAQSLNQLDRAYGPNHALLENCHIRIAFATNDERTAKRISDSLGESTEVRAQSNYAGSRASLWLDRVSVSEHQNPRALLTPGEVMQLPDDEALVLVNGRPPIRAKKLRYFQDRELKRRILPPPGEPARPPPSTAADWGEPAQAGAESPPPPERVPHALPSREPAIEPRPSGPRRRFEL
jgi:type IV secretion system protein VirD4